MTACPFLLSIGPKGSGKSHIGRLLEARCGLHFFHSRTDRCARSDPPDPSRQRLDPNGISSQHGAGLAVRSHPGEYQSDGGADTRRLPVRVADFLIQRVYKNPAAAVKTAPAKARSPPARTPDPTPTLPLRRRGSLESAQADLALLQPRIPSPGKVFLHPLRFQA